VLGEEENRPVPTLPADDNVVRRDIKSVINDEGAIGDANRVFGRTFRQGLLEGVQVREFIIRDRPEVGDILPEWPVRNGFLTELIPHLSKVPQKPIGVPCFSLPSPKL
jgi:hypothetical protein